MTLTKNSENLIVLKRIVCSAIHLTGNQAPKFNSTCKEILTSQITKAGNALGLWKEGYGSPQKRKVTRSKIAKKIIENKLLFDGQSIRKEKDTVKEKNRKEAKKMDGCSAR